MGAPLSTMLTYTLFAPSDNNRELYRNYPLERIINLVSHLFKVHARLIELIVNEKLNKRCEDMYDVRFHLNVLYRPELY